MTSSSSRDHQLSRAAVVCAQMLPATLIIPALRPWLAARGAESTFHAFISVNMIAAAIAVPFVVRWTRRISRGTVVRVAAALDALLLATFLIPMPVPALLGLRGCEGIAHVMAIVALLSDAADASKRAGTGRAIASATTGLVAAIAFGTLLGTAAMMASPLAPLAIAPVLALFVAIAAPRHLVTEPVVRAACPRRRVRGLAAPIAAAFVSRFAVGALVATFALFAHRVHGLSDREIGLCYAALTVPFAIATFPLTTLSRLFSPRPMLAVGLAGYAVMLACLGYVPTAAIVPTMIVGGVASAAVFGAVLVEAASLASSEDRTQAMAVVNSAGCLGMVFGPAAAGIVCAVVGRGTLAGYRAAFGVAAIAAALCVVAIGIAHAAKSFERSGTRNA